MAAIRLLQMVASGISFLSFLVKKTCFLSPFALRLFDRGPICLYILYKHLRWILSCTFSGIAGISGSGCDWEEDEVSLFTLFQEQAEEALPRPRPAWERRSEESALWFQ